MLVSTYYSLELNPSDYGAFYALKRETNGQAYLKYFNIDLFCEAINGEIIYENLNGRHMVVPKVREHLDQCVKK